MEIYKVVSFVFVPFIFILGFIFNKSLSLGLTSPINVFFQIISLLSFIWGFYSIISLFGWWSVLVIPIVLFFSLNVVGNFLVKRDHRSGLTAGEMLLMNQRIFGFFNTCLLIFSVLPYGLKWLNII